MCSHDYCLGDTKVSSPLPSSFYLVYNELWRNLCIFSSLFCNIYIYIYLKYDVSFRSDFGVSMSYHILDLAHHLLLQFQNSYNWIRLMMDLFNLF